MEYRLNKYISSSGYCSRREADQLIESGQVTVDGKRASVGMRVLPGQKVRVRGELIENAIEPVYIAFNKPAGVVCTADTNEKDNIVDYISHEQRIFPIGRLDKDSQGLVLLTNDGDIVNKILRAGNNHKKEYLVKVNKPVTNEFLTRMSQGIPILDRVTRPCDIKQINPFTFQIALIQGFNRQIHRMCQYLDYEVVKLERIQVLNIRLGKLGQGNWRDLTTAELEGLFDLLDKSKDVVQAKKPSNSSKSINKALKEYDIRHDYRKASLAGKKAGSPKPEKSARPAAEAPAKERSVRERSVIERPAKDRPVKKKEGSGPRIGKSKASGKKLQAKQAQQPRRGGRR